MRTRIITMLAALLLISTGAYAQSSETPLKGDVNEDGKVDVADINAIIKIMKDGGGTAEATTYYWYVGQMQPTAVNQPSVWRTSDKDAGFTETITLPAGFSWFAYPNTWTYSAKDSSGDDFAFNAFVPAVTKTSISGYILLKGPNMSSGDTITITFSK